MPDVITLLINDHRHVETLFGRVEVAAQTGAPREDVVQEIVRELSVHAAIEEEIFYPAIRQKLPDGDALADHAIEEHQEAKEILAELDGKTPENADELLTQLISSVREHVREEEAQLFPRLEEEFSQEQLEAMGEAMEAAKKAAPTHPHPHAPSKGPGAVVGGTVAGLVDKARDAIRRD